MIDDRSLGLLKRVPCLSLPVGVEKEFRLPEGSRQRFRRRHSATARPLATLSIPARTVHKTPTIQLQHPLCRPALHAGQQLHCIGLQFVPAEPARRIAPFARCRFPPGRHLREVRTVRPRAFGEKSKAIRLRLLEDNPAPRKRVNYLHAYPKKDRKLIGLTPCFSCILNPYKKIQP